MKPTTHWLGVVMALGAAVAYGINAVAIKEGIQRFDVGLSGLSIAIVVGLLTMAPLALWARPREPVPRRAYGFIMLSGLCSACGIGSYFLALTLEPVSVVVPISSAYPLVTLALARIFLGQSERLTWRTVAGACCVCVGVIIVALNRSQ